MRRRARGSGNNLGENQNRGLQGFWIRNPNRNVNVVSEDARPPPSYDVIYMSSIDVNPLPSYTTVVNFKNLETSENKLSSNNNNDHITTNTITQSTIDPIDNNNYYNIPNVNSMNDVINSNNSSIVNGEVNLTFSEEPVSINNINNNEREKE